MDAVSLTTILSNVTEFFTAAIGWMGDVFDIIVSNPVLLLMVVCMPVAGIGIGYANRLLRG